VSYTSKATKLLYSIESYIYIKEKTTPSSTVLNSMLLKKADPLEDFW
jgi:hypothetical protein